MNLQVSAIWMILVLNVVTITGCSNPSGTQNKAKEILDITVSIVPQKYFVRKIGGDRVKINVMVKSGVDFHNYEPKPEQLQALSHAEAYITIGIPFERAWIDKISGANTQLQIIDSAKGIKRLPMINHDHHEHHYDKSRSENATETLDPHIWLSPTLAKIQAKNIYQGLTRLDPNYQVKYLENLEIFLQEIEQLGGQIKENLSQIKNRKFIVFHPAWGYFANEYNLTQIPVEVGGQGPSPAELGKLIKEAKEEKIKVIFAQPELNINPATIIAKEIDGEVLLISPLEPNWSENLLKVSETLSNVLD
ncbi:zinc ABC transporter periplasmic binding protein [cyanobacterium endosymbiont of Rhopalodia gibberula]|uniref:metal ABC transporter solute-binding protein, Zn/Mn family n=1 Tax=cyanobacterium endosymbiont of Rhopalodia gibberula TaxID=1763363 RepID=UPI000DC6D462|nr:zinc ABC transporter substrate-binding protein [cyanobacterium endosymbiont of Rhopalodia gibberula]BBA80169.1 zinc ABC transporter periplasmic binding protein [cyanobacterium endosymbiont of Rhopalodia gibberula]